MSLITHNGKKICNVILTGDFNLPSLKWVNGYNVTSENSELTQYFMSVIDNNFLYQHVSQPTRITDKTCNILDLLFTSHPSDVSKVNIIPGISDHEAISFIIFCMNNSELKKKHIYFYSKANFEQFRKDLKEAPLSEENRDVNVKEYWQLIKSTIIKICDANVPHGNLRKGSNDPWVDKDLRKLMRKRNRAFKKAKRTTKRTHWEKYRQLRKEVKKKVKLNYVNYLRNDICNSLKRNPKLFWNFIKSRKCDRGMIDCLNVSGRIITEDQQKADVFNEQFNQIFSNCETLSQPESNSNAPIMEDIQCTEAEVLKLLKNVDISKAQGPDELAPCLLKEGAEQLAPALCKLYKPESNSNAPIMEDIQCTEAKVLKLLKNVDISKAQGPDELAPCLLKEGAEQLAPALCKLFNLSLSSGVLPADWQKANICPLYKKGNKQDPGNYRPISLTSITCKILERIICKRLI